MEISGNDVVVEFDSVTGKSYQLQANSDLDPAGWIEVDTILSAAGGVEVLTVTNGATAAIGRRFFRLVTPAPAP